MAIPHTVVGIRGRISTAASAVMGAVTPIIAVGPVSAFTGAVAVSMVAATMAVAVSMEAASTGVDSTAGVEVSVSEHAPEALRARVAASTPSGVAGDHLP